MNKKTRKIAVEAGLSLAALAAAAAGTYFLSGKKGAKNRKKIKGWMLKAKGEILQEMEHMNSMREDIYHHTIDAMAHRYQLLKNVDKKELDQLVKELKGHWKHIKKDIAKTQIKKISKKK